jgi:hypothetical protein
LVGCKLCFPPRNPEARSLGIGTETKPQDEQFKESNMARTQIKVCGPTRGKRRVRKMGMGSGARRAAAKAKCKTTRG